jgi:MoxR-like ATPase
VDSKNAYAIVEQITAELEKVFIGQSEVIEQSIIALLSGGHALLEGVPGTGKTLLVKALSMITGNRFRRVQFTPDLMPSDILGVNIFDVQAKKFEFRPGPVFCDIFLADEINRSPAKTQSALLEVMEEKQATVDGVTHLLSPVFTVFATQNPVEFEGTYPLPEAQVDRFMLKILIDYPQEEAETEILSKVEGGFDAHQLDQANLRTILTNESIQQLRGFTRSLHAAEPVRQYITRIIRQTRTYPQITLGASPRAGVMLLLAAKAKALMNQRDYVTPDDVKDMACPVLRHRILLMPEAEVEGVSTDDCLARILAQVEVPR